MTSFTENLEFSPGLLEDLDEIMAIEAVSFSHPWTESMVLSELFDHPFAFSTVVRMRKEKKIIAYAFMRILLDELHLMDFAVHPAWRRRGIGMQLIQQVLLTAREKGIEKILLEVRASNLPAQRLYQKFGFFQIGERRNYYYKPREDAFVYQLNRVHEIPPFMLLENGASEAPNLKNAALLTHKRNILSELSPQDFNHVSKEEEK